MSVIKNLLAVAILGGIVSSATAQTSVPLELVWKVQADDVASSYILSSGDQTRGMFLNKTAATGGSLLVPTRTANNLVRRVDPTTGALKDPAVMPGGYSGTATTFGLNKVVVSDDGIIYVGSLGLGGATEQHFRIYRHADEFSGPSVASDVRTDNAGFAGRLGDDMDIIGTGNNTQILVSGTGSNFVVLFTTADGGLTFTGQKITMTPPAAGTPHIAWDPTTPNRFFYRDATPNVYHAYDISGTTATGATGSGNELPGPTVLAYGPFDIGLVNGINSVALGIGGSGAGNSDKPVIIYKLSDLNQDYYGIGTEFQPGGSKANGNASGDVYLDTANNALYILYTNNSVTKFRIPGASVNKWSLY